MPDAGVVDIGTRLRKSGDEREEAPVQKTSLTAVAREELATALASTSGRAARTVFGGHEHVLRQTLIAMRAGVSLAPHNNPGEATLQVLVGRVVMSANGESWSGWIGDHLIIPNAVHEVEALEDSVILLTVAKRTHPNAAVRVANSDPATEQDREHVMDRKDDATQPTKKPDGLGTDGTIPNEPGGVGVGAGEATTFEPEEDPEAAANRDEDAAPNSDT